MKKGFTLIELVAVVLLIGLLTLFAIPAITNQVAKKGDEVDQITKNIIYSATELYVIDHDITVSSGTEYCNITLQKLIDEGYLDKSSATYASGDAIPTNQIIKITKGSYNENQFELVKKCE